MSLNLPPVGSDNPVTASQVVPATGPVIHTTSLPRDVWRIIFKILKYDGRTVRSLLLTCKVFRTDILGAGSLIDVTLRKIIGLTPVILKVPDIKYLERTAIDVQGDQVVYACGGTVVQYDCRSGNVKNLKFDPNAKSKFVHQLKDGQTIFVQAAENLSYIIASENEKLIEKASIQHCGGYRSDVVHSRANQQGFFAETLLASRQIDIYHPDRSNDRKTLSLQNPPDSDFNLAKKDLHCMDLALSKDHLYATYTNFTMTEYEKNFIQCYDLESGNLIATTFFKNRPRHIALGDDVVVVSFETGAFAIFDKTSLKLICQQKPVYHGDKGWIEVLKVFKENIYLGLNDGQVQIRNIATGELEGNIDRNAWKSCNPNAKHPGRVHNRVMDLALHGHYLAVAPLELHQVEIWDMRTGLLLHRFITESRPYQVKFDDDFLVAGLENGSAKVWHINAIAPKVEEIVEEKKNPPTPAVNEPSPVLKEPIEPPKPNSEPVSDDSPSTSIISKIKNLFFQALESFLKLLGKLRKLFTN